MKNLQCAVLFFGLCLTVIWASPDCQPGKADIIVLFENSKDIDGSDFAKMKEDVKSFIHAVKIGTGKGEVVIALRTFAQILNPSESIPADYFKSKFESAKKLVLRLKDLKRSEHKDENASNMVDAMDFVTELLRLHGRTDAHHYVIYVGSGKNSVRLQELQDMKRMLDLAATKVFGIVALQSTTSGITDIFDGYSTLGTNDTFLRVMNVLYPKCAECFEPVLDLAIVMMDSGPEDKFNVMKEIIMKTLEPIKIGEKTKISIISYGRKPYNWQSLIHKDQSMTKSDIIEHVNGMMFQGASQLNIYDALKYTISYVFRRNGAREDATKVAILVSRDPQPDNFRVEKMAAGYSKNYGIHLVIAGFENFSYKIVSSLTGGSRWSAMDGQAFPYGKEQTEGYGKDLAQRTCLIGFP